MMIKSFKQLVIEQLKLKRFYYPLFGMMVFVFLFVGVAILSPLMFFIATISGLIIIGGYLIGKDMEND